ncbi:unnamed protein product [Closterium sp. Naga37s-1]|nr:unnamed protein product [Closterium sp. Naga37s-1]
MQFLDDEARRSWDAASVGMASVTGTERRHGDGDDESRLMLKLLMHQQSMLQQLLEARRSAGEGQRDVAPWVPPQTTPDNEITSVARGAEDGGEKQDMNQHECYNQQQQEEGGEPGGNAMAEARSAVGMPELDTSELTRQLALLHVADPLTHLEGLAASTPTSATTSATTSASASASPNVAAGAGAGAGAKDGSWNSPRSGNNSPHYHSGESLISSFHPPLSSQLPSRV